ncbi:MAG: hypothetical protein ACRDFQ_03150 [Anaerolineales bacterium]
MNLRSWLTLILACACFACSSSKETQTEIIDPTTASPTLTTTATTTNNPKLTQTPTVTQPPPPSPTPTPIEYAILRGKVIVDGRLSCRFGPGTMYLYKFSFAGGTSIEVVGRMEYSRWVLVRAIGGTNRCWVNGGPQFLQIDGDPMSLRPVDPHIVLAWSPYYGAMGGIGASRQGNVVTVRWGGIQLRAGDDSEQTPYIVEAWVCQGGEFVFAPVGSYGFSAEIIDEPGCAERSHARAAAAEKHGYTPWVEVDWPAYRN